MAEDDVRKNVLVRRGAPWQTWPRPTLLGKSKSQKNPRGDGWMRRAHSSHVVNASRTSLGIGRLPYAPLEGAAAITASRRCEPGPTGGKPRDDLINYSGALHCFRVTSLSWQVCATTPSHPVCTLLIVLHCKRPLRREAEPHQAEAVR